MSIESHKHSISAIVCTWNRAEMLDMCLEALCAADIPQGWTLEIIVVDNASSDGTAEVLKQLQLRLPIRCTYESQAGLSHARNHGVRLSRGEWLVFLDDDAEIQEDYFCRVVEGLSVFPECVYAGTPIIPVLAQPVRAWLREVESTYKWCFSKLDYGPPLRLMGPKERPFGASLILRRDLIGETGFDTKLGFSHGTLLGGEDVAVVSSLVDAGHRGCWIPMAPVRHHIPASRTRLRFLLRRTFWQGVSHTAGTEPKLSRFVVGRLPAWTFRAVALATLNLLFSLMLFRRRWGVNALTLAIRLGECRGFLLHD